MALTSTASLSRRSFWSFIFLLISTAVATASLGGGLIDLAVGLYVLLLIVIRDFSERTWSELKNSVGPHLDGIVGDLDERAEAARWMSNRLRTGQQIWCSLLGGLFACALAVLTIAATSGHLAWEAPFVLAVTATGVLGGNVLYWLDGGAQWLWRFRELKSIRLRTVPENDPAMQGCRRLLKHVIKRVTIGVLLCQAPLLALDALHPTNKFLVIETMVIGALCAVALVAITVGPALCLGHIKFVDQQNKVKHLQNELDALQITGSELLERRCQLESATSAILARPRHKVDVPAMLTVASTIVAVFVPFLVSVMLELPTIL